MVGGIDAGSPACPSMLVCPVHAELQRSEPKLAPMPRSARKAVTDDLGFAVINIVGFRPAVMNIVGRA